MLSPPAARPELLTRRVRSGVASRQRSTVWPARNTRSTLSWELRGLGGVRGLLLGSVATQLLHLTDVPVTLVK